MIGHVANGPGDNDLLHSDTAVGGLVGGGLAGHLSRPLLDLPRHGKQPALPALATATLQDPPVLLLLPQLVLQAQRCPPRPLVPAVFLHPVDIYRQHDLRHFYMAAATS